MQLVLCNNRVMAHGEGFLSMGGVVINPETGAKYEGATIAECDSCPSDIGKVGYEYKAGQFIPCAPFGKGDGTVPVLCGDSCKAIKDSGLSITDMCIIERKPYLGVGSSRASITFNHPPVVVFFRNQGNSGWFGYINVSGGVFFLNGSDLTAKATAETNGNTLTWENAYPERICNQNGGQYEAIALCIRGL